MATKAINNLRYESIEDR